MMLGRCVVSRLYETCSRYGISKAEAVVKARGLTGSDKELSWVRVKHVATMDAKSACAIVADPAELTPLVDALTAAFEAVKDEFIHT